MLNKIWYEEEVLMKSEILRDIKAEDKKQLIKAQQGELDAVILYRRLAQEMKDTNNRETFLKIAADEGKHAGILRKYTGENLSPKNLKAIVVITIYKVFGLKFTIKMLSKGEFKAAKEYYLLAEDFPSIKEIIKDEELHGKLMENIL
jgi:rubrerythrin